MPDAPGLELIARDINEAEAGTVLETSCVGTYATLLVDPAKVIAALRWLHDTPGQEYTFLSSVHGADYYPAEPRFSVHYELLNMARVERLHVKALLPDTESNGNGADAELPAIDSCVELYPTADFQEREVYDFFGIEFRGHPDLRRILMPEDYVGWPQRRDFPVGGDPVLFTKDEPASPGWYE
jgi:NADH-quinone oxidoreductase subunit C